MHVVVLIIVALVLISILKNLYMSISGFYNFIFVENFYISVAAILIALAWTVSVFKKKQINLITARDSDEQSVPYDYEIGMHGNQTLALRYGIANLQVKNIPYYYFGKGGVKKRNASRDRKEVTASLTIRLRKLKRLEGDNIFLVELSDFKNRKAIAVHVKGDDFIKTFYPINPLTNTVDNDWWLRNSDLELVLKDNKSFTLKELAKYHVEKTIPQSF